MQRNTRSGGIRFRGEVNSFHGGTILVSSSLEVDIICKCHEVMDTKINGLRHRWLWKFAGTRARFQASLGGVGGLEHHRWRAQWCWVWLNRSSHAGVTLTIVLE